LLGATQYLTVEEVTTALEELRGMQVAVVDVTGKLEEVGEVHACSCSRGQ